MNHSHLCLFKDGSERVWFSLAIALELLAFHALDPGTVSSEALSDVCSVDLRTRQEMFEEADECYQEAGRLGRDGLWVCFTQIRDDFPRLPSPLSHRA